MRSLLINSALLVILVLSHIFGVPSLLSLVEKKQFLVSENAPLVVLTRDVSAHSTFEALTPEQRAGQRLFISIPAGSSEEAIREIFSNIHPGGVLLFASNISSAAQTQTLTSMLRRVAEELGDPPLFIAVDEEGGVVERIWFDPVGYSAFELGEIDDDELTARTTQDTASTLIDLGFNVNFAPVADIAYDTASVMYGRSFGSDPDTVAHQVAISVSAFLENGVMPTVKHFPGHGRSDADSHYTLPTVSISKEEWLATDAKPFIDAIEEDVPFIMSGHLQFPSIDSEPASSSEVWLMQLLREELGYNGIIVSDDIKMGAYDQPYSTTVVQFIDAGNDMVIAALDPESLSDITAAVQTRTTDNESEQQAKDSLLRVLRTKLSLYPQE